MTPLRNTEKRIKTPEEKANEPRFRIKFGLGFFTKETYYWFLPLNEKAEGYPCIDLLYQL